jgi:hypothetical protein
MLCFNLRILERVLSRLFLKTIKYPFSSKVMVKFKKRGFFFMIDVAFSLAILALGILILVSSYSHEPDIAATESTSSDMLNFFTRTQIEDINDPIIGLGGTMMQQGLITRQQNTLIQQIGEFMMQGNLSRAETFINQSLKGILPPQYLFELQVDGQRIFPLNQTLADQVSKNATSLLVSRSTVAYGIANQGSDLWGPSTFTLMVWQKW